MDNLWKAVTAFLALGVAYIAFQQFIVARERLKLDLFDRRFAVFAAVRRFLTDIQADAKCPMPRFFVEFRRSVAEADFLFESDITTFIEEIDQHALQLWLLNEQDPTTPKGETKAKMAQDIANQLKWLTDQLPELKPTFAPYLKFAVWRRGFFSIRS